LWALEWEWHPVEIPLLCARFSRIFTLFSFNSFRDISVQSNWRTFLDRLSYIMGSETLSPDQEYRYSLGSEALPSIKNMYTLLVGNASFCLMSETLPSTCRKRFLLPVTYFPTNIIYHITLQVMGIHTIIVNFLAFKT